MGADTDPGRHAAADAAAAPLDLLLSDAATGMLRLVNPGGSGLRLAAALAARPRLVARRGTALAGELARIAAGRSQVQPSRRDRRFADPGWAGNPLLRRAMQAYLAAAQTAEGLEHVTAEIAAKARCEGRPIFIPQDEFSAWAWLPLGARHDIAWPELSAKGIGAADGIRFAFGEPALGLPGFRRTHQQALGAQALGAQAVALAAGPSGQLVTSFGEVAPLALMSGSIELLQAWATETLGALADDDENHARLRDTLRVFLQENGSYKTTAERLMLHKNTVQYRVRKAEEILQRPVAQNRLHIELALLATHWLGRAALRPAGEPGASLPRPEG